jgi:hypothetical protein
MYDVSSKREFQVQAPSPKIKLHPVRIFNPLQIQILAYLL